MHILALDCATKTGWAVHRSGTIEAGVQDFSLKRGESPGMRFIRFDLWLAQMILLINPEMIIYEMAHHRGGAPTAVLLGMIAILQKQCAASGIDHTSVHSSKIKKFATGKGNAKKEDMIEAAKGRFPVIEIIDDNQADALFILAWCMEEYSIV